MKPFAGKLIFIGGSPRSGTTLVRQILNSHPEIFAGGEFDLIPLIVRLWNDGQFRIRGGKLKNYISPENFETIIRKLVFDFLDPNRKRTQKKHIAEKTPSNVLVFDDLHQIFPDAYLIHVIRDGRDVICSMMEVADLHEKHSRDIPPMINRIDSCAKTWREYVLAPRANKKVYESKEFQQHYFEIRYEELTHFPDEVIRQLCDWLGVDFSEKMTSHHLEDHEISYDNRWFTKEKLQASIHTESHERWEEELSFGQRLIVAYYCQPTLKALGYAHDKKWIFNDIHRTLWIHPFKDLTEITRLLLRFIQNRIQIR